MKEKINKIIFGMFVLFLSFNVFSEGTNNNKLLDNKQ